MKKNTLFLSAAITTFILAILAGVVFKARASGFGSPPAAVAPTAASTQAPTDTLQPTDRATMLPTTAAFISPQEAVFIASSALGNTQVYSVDTETRYGLDVYKVTFSSGHIVFVSPQGHILTITALQPNVVAPISVQQSNNQQSGDQQVGNQPSNDQQSDDQPSPINNTPAPTSEPHDPGEGDEHPGGDD